MIRTMSCGPVRGLQPPCNLQSSSSLSQVGKIAPAIFLREPATPSALTSWRWLLSRVSTITGVVPECRRGCIPW